MNTENQAPVAATSENRIETNKTFGKIEVSQVYTGKYQKEGTLTAELKQTVKTISLYPEKSVTSSFQDNVFGLEDFGFGKKEYESTEVRVAWIDVPMGSTKESVEAKLQAFPEATLYKILSNHPLISDNQEAGISRGYTTKDIIANSQVVRYPKTHETSPEKLILDVNGKVQYRGVYFKASPMEDMDKRTKEVSDVYLTPEIKQELSPAMSNVASDNIN